MAYPAESDLDTQLRTLIYDPKTAFGALYSLDQESGRMLNFYFCGYSLVRQFYDIRDQGVSMQKGAKFNRRSLERKRAAAESLVALIHSASDGIYGGTYDSERRSSLSADTLLVLLGEALVFTEGWCDPFSRHYCSTPLPRPSHHGHVFIHELTSTVPARIQPFPYS